MKIKPLPSIVVLNVLALCLFAVCFRSEPQHSTIKEIVVPVIEMDQKLPHVAMAAPSKHQNPEVAYIDQNPEPSYDQDESFYIEEENDALPPPEQIDPPTRDEVIVEPPPEIDDAFRLVDSVEVMEVEVTGMLLVVDMPDDQIDSIFDKVRSITQSDIEEGASPEDYLGRLKVLARLIRQSDMDSEQISMAIDDIFAHQGGAVQRDADSATATKADT